MALNGKQQKFRNLAEKRVSGAVKKIREIGKLSRRASYEYTDVEVAQMFDAMRGEIDAAEAKFAPPTQQPKQPLFSFE